jgi:3-oxoacyl-[acyl-carrier protein] reductase
MDRSFSGRVAFITGASDGGGQALARRLAAEGAVLDLGYGARGQAGEALAAEITSAGGRAIAVGADLCRPEAPGQLVQAVADALGRWMCWSATPG